MDPIIALVSDSFAIGFGSGFNSVQSDSDKAWCYANHVMNGPQHVMGGDDGWFESIENEYSSHSEHDETESTRDGEDDVSGVTSRQKQNFRPRFGRQPSISSTSSANEKKEKSKSKKHTSKSPPKTRNITKVQNHTKSCLEDKPTLANTTAKVSSFISRSEPDKEERRTIRRLALARKKSEIMWGSSLDMSDSDESNGKKYETTTKLKKFRKKTYVYDDSISPIRGNKGKDKKHSHQRTKEEDVVHVLLECKSERSNSPQQSTQSSLCHERKFKPTTTKKNRSSSQQRKVIESETDSSVCSPQTRKHLKNRSQYRRDREESGRSLSPAKVSQESKTRPLNQWVNDNERSSTPPKNFKESNETSSESKHTKKEMSTKEHCRSERARSYSPSKLPSHSTEPGVFHSSEKKNNHCEVIPKGSSDKCRSTGKVSSSYEMIPTGSMRQNRPNDLIPTGSLRRSRSTERDPKDNYGTIGFSKHHAYAGSTKQEGMDEVLVIGLQPSAKIINQYSEKNTVHGKRQQSITVSQQNCEWKMDSKFDEKLAKNKVPSTKGQSLLHQSSYTKRTPKKLDESLLNLTRSERVEKSRQAVTTPKSNRDYFSHSSPSSSTSTTSPSLPSTGSLSIKGSTDDGVAHKSTTKLKKNHGHQKKYATIKQKELNIKGGSSAMENDTTCAVQHGMKSHRFRKNNNVELQKKTNQYLAAITTTSNKGTNNNW